MRLNSEAAAEDFKLLRMTDAQMSALEQFIVASRNATEFAKKAILFAIRRSENLTKPVSVTVLDPDLASEMQDGAHGMNSVNGSTQIDLFFQGMGTEFCLSHLCGRYTSPGKFDPAAEGRTIWLSHTLYDREAEWVVADPASINETQFPPSIFNKPLRL